MWRNCISKLTSSQPPLSVAALPATMKRTIERPLRPHNVRHGVQDSPWTALLVVGLVCAHSFTQSVDWQLFRVHDRNYLCCRHKNMYMLPPPPFESGRRDHSKMFESSCVELTCSNILMTQLFILKGMLNRNSKLAKQHWGGRRDAAKPPKHHT